MSVCQEGACDRGGWRQSTREDSYGTQNSQGSAKMMGKQARLAEQAEIAAAAAGARQTLKQEALVE